MASAPPDTKDPDAPAALPYPDFLIIGAPRSGAETLKAALSATPGIWFPPIDNILAFHPAFNLMRVTTLRKLMKKELPLKNPFWLLRYFLTPAPTPKWYSKLYRIKDDTLIKGEYSDEYMTLPYDGVMQLHRVMPKVKIVLVVRNPIDRAFADIKHRFAKHPKMPFAKMSKKQMVGVMNNDWAKTHSGYQLALDNWGTFFPSKQMFVCFHDDLMTDPQTVYKKLFAFLGLPKTTTLPELKPAQEKPFPVQLYSHLSQFYRREIEGIIARIGGAAKNWEAPAEPVQEKSKAVLRSEFKRRRPQGAEAPAATPPQA